ncbi:MAG: helicase-associated domain-containing protein [Planctomycetota bacterium]|nr:helicase-associated domain-containing protein [Planctomycetota bacterium]
MIRQDQDHTPGQNGNGAQGDKNGGARCSRARSADAVSGVRDHDLPELYRFWSGQRATRLPEDAAELRRQVVEWMAQASIVEARVALLPRRLLSILDLHLESPRYQCTAAELLNARHLAYMSSYDLQASLAVLGRHALVVETKSPGVDSFGARSWTVPQDVGDAILRQRRARRRGIFDAFTLRGHIDRMYDDPSRAQRTPPSRVREMYKLYANESAAVGRVERLPDGLRQLIEKTIVEFGGILPKNLFDRMDSPIPWDGRRWGHVLEESLVGTVERLELGRYGIQHNDETLIVFNEVALAWLRRVAVPGDPDKPFDESCLGVDLASNLSRFIAYVVEHDVRFTVRGEIFKTTERRIQEELLPNPGRELSRADVLTFLYGFTRGARLIESTGERTFALTTAGRDWEAHDLDAKLRMLLEHAIEERDLPGEHHHQVRMRRILMRLLKRVEPGVWYDLMYVPFLSRNTYLCSLDDLAVDEYFAARFQGGGYTPMDDIQRLAWHLVTWVKQRLYLLGLVDLGYDKAGRPVAMRLTRIGARLLGVVDGAPETTALVGSLIVTPDFEVVLFPTGDDGELIHDLDRFCTRDKQGGVMSFRISERSVQRALHEGMYLKRILATLERHSRTPVPQNVIFSVRDWAARAGCMHLGADYVVSADDADLVSKFRGDPGVKPLLRESLDDRRTRLRAVSTLRRTQSLLRELGYLVEIDEGAA